MNERYHLPNLRISKKSINSHQPQLGNNDFITPQHSDNSFSFPVTPSQSVLAHQTQSVTESGRKKLTSRSKQLTEKNEQNRIPVRNAFSTTSMIMTERKNYISKKDLLVEKETNELLEYFSGFTTVDQILSKISLNNSKIKTLQNENKPLEEKYSSKSMQKASAINLLFTGKYEDQLKKINKQIADENLKNEKLRISMLNPVEEELEEIQNIYNNQNFILKELFYSNKISSELHNNLIELLKKKKRKEKIILREDDEEFLVSENDDEMIHKLRHFLHELKKTDEERAEKISELKNKIKEKENEISNMKKKLVHLSVLKLYKEDIL